VVSTNIAHDIFLAITIEIGKLDLVWMANAKIGQNVAVFDDVALAVEEDSMMLAVLVAANDIHLAVSIEVGVVDDVIAVAELFLEASHVLPVTACKANTVLGPVSTAAWVIADHVGPAVSVQVNPLEVSTLAVLIVKQQVGITPVFSKGCPRTTEVAGMRTYRWVFAEHIGFAISIGVGPMGSLSIASIDTPMGLVHAEIFLDASASIREDGPVVTIGIVTE